LRQADQAPGGIFAFTLLPFQPSAEYPEACAGMFNCRDDRVLATQAVKVSAVTLTRLSAKILDCVDHL